MHNTRPLLAVIALGSLALGGCATVFKSKEGTISVTSDTPGAQVMLDGRPVGQTPANVTVSNKQGSIITVQANGKRADCNITSSASGGWIVADIFLTSGLGLIIDWVTGAWNNAGPEACHLSV